MTFISLPPYVDRLDNIQIFRFSYSFIIDTVKNENTALSWLQWIDKRSKLKLKTKTTPEPRTTTTIPPTTVENRISIDPFLELLSLTNLHYPGPRINTTTETTKTTPTTRTSTTTTTMTTTSIRNRVSTSSSSTTMSYETWSWWSPSNDFDTNEIFEDDQKEVENENSKMEAVNKYEEMTISTTTEKVMNLKFNEYKV